MSTRRAPRIVVSGFLLAVAVLGLTACRTSPSVAAYVGDEQVTVTELEAAVDERTADEQIAAAAAADETQFTRQVLDLLVQREVHTAAAERYDVDVTDSQVRSLIDEAIGDNDPDTVFDQYAQQGISRADIFETVRQQLIRREIALLQGEVEEPSEEELRASYEQAREGLAEVRFGYITVPDQATADAVRAALEADPSRYDALATQYAGQTTLPQIRQSGLGEVPAEIAEQVSTARPNSAFTLTVDQVPGVIVAFVEGLVYPSFEDLRPQLEQEFTDAADAAGTSAVDAVREDLDVVVNPRYGGLDDTGRLVPGSGGVVQLLEDQGQGGAEGGENADSGAGN